MGCAKAPQKGPERRRAGSRCATGVAPANKIEETNKEEKTDAWSAESGEAIPATYRQGSKFAVPIDPTVTLSTYAHLFDRADHPGKALEASYTAMTGRRES